MSKASAYYTVNNLDNTHDMKIIKKELGAIAGVLSVSVNSDKGHDNVAVDFDTTSASAGKEKIGKKLNELGYEVTADRFENHIM